MALAFFIYTFLLLMLMSVAFFARNLNSKQSYFVIFISIVLYSLIIGMRYNVGADYLTYMNDYNNQSIERYEIGFKFLNNFFYHVGFPFPLLCIFIAFCQLFLVYSGFKKYRELFPWIIFFYFTTLYIFFSINGMRQALAISIVIYSFQFIQERKLLRFTFTILVAMSIHKSAIVLLPFYFIANYELLRNRLIQYLLYITFVALGFIFKDYIWQLTSIAAPIIGYEDISENIEHYQEINWSNNGFGLSVYFWFILNSLIIFYYDRLKIAFPNKMFIILYNIFFVGLLINEIVSATYLARMNAYFLNIRIFIYAYFILYIFKYQKTNYLKFAGVFIIMILFLFFLLGIYNKASMCAPFQFI